MSIVSDSSVNKSVRSHFSRPYSPRERIRYELGIVDGETGFDRYFKGTNGFIRVLTMAQTYVNRGLLFSKKGKENAINQVYLQRLRQIWHGPTWKIVIRDPNDLGRILQVKIAYQHYNLPSNIESIPFPALKNMNPLDQIKSEKFLLRMRQPVKISDALGGMDYKQVVLQGKWYHAYKFNFKPLFHSQSDIEQNAGITMTVGRRWFFSTINWLGQFAEEPITELDADLQELLNDDLKKGMERNNIEKQEPQFATNWDD